MAQHRIQVERTPSRIKQNRTWNFDSITPITGSNADEAGSLDGAVVDAVEMTVDPKRRPLW